MIRKSFLSVLAIFCVAGCTTVPLSSMVKLSSVDMGSTAPEAIRVAYITPHVLRVKQGDLFMNLRLKSNDGAYDIQKKLDLLLDETPPPPNVFASKGPEEDVHILKLRPEDVVLFRNLQKGVNEAKAAGRKGSLEINFGSKACAEKPIIGPVMISAFIKTSELSDYILLVNKANVTELAKQAGEDPVVKPCGK
ncbi:MAG: hypothetical protein KGO94_04290 [Alphaproteobacteria bacterium]|nr:hypothetical protein [Alphaproteobacteria bacterium]